MKFKINTRNLESFKKDIKTHLTSFETIPMICKMKYLNKFRGHESQSVEFENMEDIKNRVLKALELRIRRACYKMIIIIQ